MISMRFLMVPDVVVVTNAEGSRCRWDMGNEGLDRDECVRDIE